MVVKINLTKIDIFIDVRTYHSYRVAAVLKKQLVVNYNSQLNWTLRRSFRNNVETSITQNNRRTLIGRNESPT